MWGWFLVVFLVAWFIGFTQAALYMRGKILLGRFELDGKIYRIVGDKEYD